MSCFELN